MTMTIDIHFPPMSVIDHSFLPTMTITDRDSTGSAKLQWDSIDDEQRLILMDIQCPLEAVGVFWLWATFSVEHTVTQNLHVF